MLSQLSLAHLSLLKRYLTDNLLIAENYIALPSMFGIAMPTKCLTSQFYTVPLSQHNPYYSNILLMISTTFVFYVLYVFIFIHNRKQTSRFVNSLCFSPGWSAVSLTVTLAFSFYYKKLFLCFMSFSDLLKRAKWLLYS